MDNSLKLYGTMVAENLDYINDLREKLVYWEKIYKSRVFDEKWPSDIKSLMDGIKLDIKATAEDIKYYIKRFKEINDGYTRIIDAQIAKDTGNVGQSRGESQDTDNDVARVESQDVGIAQ